MGREGGGGWGGEGGSVGGRAKGRGGAREGEGRGKKGRGGATGVGCRGKGGRRNGAQRHFAKGKQRICQPFQPSKGDRYAMPQFHFGQDLIRQN